ncbi:MAG: YeeE/YedE family protein [Candidatus Marinimicrobia bacterium]|nr:YeeE/YedE family protein [Candidatus Neomarinimicrobiota bacterium]
MGPLVPQEIIGADWNFFIAFVVGIGFGFVLEQAGFSSSRKLAGMFYGYDTVVLKVFFTAAITAMLGLLFFSLFGWINLNLIYVNPTFLGSAIAGGVIMGAGFIIGGFCPGTSVCAAAIGKIDAMVFVGGIFLGIFIFAEGYPLLEDFYMSGSMGPIKVSDVLGISGGVMALLVIIAALVMFKLGELAEKKWPREEY